MLALFSLETLLGASLDLFFGLLDRRQSILSTGQLIRNIDLRLIFGIGLFRPSQQLLNLSA